jgi:hypothetical protein
MHEQLQKFVSAAVHMDLGDGKHVFFDASEMKVHVQF